MFSDGLFQLNYGMEDKQPLKIALQEERIIKWENVIFYKYIKRIRCNNQATNIY